MIPIMDTLTKQTKTNTEDTIKEDKEFQKELDFWDYLSDEALAKSGL